MKRLKTLRSPGIAESIPGLFKRLEIRSQHVFAGEKIGPTVAVNFIFGSNPGKTFYKVKSAK